MIGAAINWHKMFVPTVSLLELFLRVSAVYLGILVMMRLLRRQKGALNTADLLVLVIIADAAQNAMSADYDSLTEGAVLIGAIFFWDFMLDALSYRFRAFDKLLNPASVLLVKNGALLRKNLRSEMITIDELNQQLREQGIEDISLVKSCQLECDGHFSIIRVDSAGQTATAPRTAAAIT